MCRRRSRKRNFRRILHFRRACRAVLLRSYIPSVVRYATIISQIATLGKLFIDQIGENNKKKDGKYKKCKSEYRAEKEYMTEKVCIFEI